MKSNLSLLFLILFVIEGSYAQDTQDPTPKLWLGFTLREIKDYYGDTGVADKPVFGGIYEMTYKGAKIRSHINSDDLADSNEAVYKMRCTMQSFMVNEKDEALLKELIDSWKLNSEQIERGSFRNRSGTTVYFDVSIEKI